MSQITYIREMFSSGGKKSQKIWTSLMVEFVPLDCMTDTVSHYPHPAPPQIRARKMLSEYRLSFMQTTNTCTKVFLAKGNSEPTENSTTKQQDNKHELQNLGLKLVFYIANVQKKNCNLSDSESLYKSHQQALYCMLSSTDKGVQAQNRKYQNKQWIYVYIVHCVSESLSK